MNLLRLNFTVLFVFCFILISKGQFNEALAMEIAALDKKYDLDGIDKSDALDRLLEIAPKIPKATIEALFPGKTWKYSHSVSHVGRRFRISNAMKRLDFSANGHSFFTTGKKEAPVTTYCTWDYAEKYQLRLDQFETNKRTESTYTAYFSIHSLTSDRLVLTKIIRSKEHSGKNAILFYVYFR